MAEQVDAIFRRRIREERQLLGWSQARLAEEAGGRDAGLYQTTVAKIEGTGKGTPREVSLREAMALAAALDMPLTGLVVPRDLDGSVQLGAHEVDAPTAVDWMLGRHRLGPPRPIFLSTEEPWNRMPMWVDEDRDDETEELVRLGRWAREVARQMNQTDGTSEER